MQSLHPGELWRWGDIKRKQNQKGMQVFSLVVSSGSHRSIYFSKSELEMSTLNFILIKQSILSQHF